MLATNRGTSEQTQKCTDQKGRGSPKTHRQLDHWNRKPRDQSGVWKMQVRVAGFNAHLSPFLHWNTYPGAASKLSLKNARRTEEEKKEEGRRIRETESGKGEGQGKRRKTEERKRRGKRRKGEGNEERDMKSVSPRVFTVFQALCYMFCIYIFI